MGFFVLTTINIVATDVVALCLWGCFMSIDIRPSVYTIRVFGEGKTYDNADSYKAVISMNMLDDETAYLFAATGTISIEEYKTVYKMMQEMGIKKYLMKRRGKLVERTL